MVLVAAVMPAAVAGSALIVAIVFAVGVALLRLAFGGHFLSDVIFAALFTHVIAIVVFGLMHDERWRFGRPGELDQTLRRLGSRLRRRFGCL
jgi:membrane-associated phospholipid phosphatase